jgi:hypothetical protein
MQKVAYHCTMNNAQNNTTANERKSIQRIIEGGYVEQDCKIGRTSYRVTKNEAGYEVKIGKQTRGLGFYGEPLRFTVRTIQVEL